MPNMSISAAERGGFRQIQCDGHLLTVSQRYVTEEGDGESLRGDAQILAVSKCGADEFVLSHPLDVTKDFFDRARRAVQDFAGAN